MPERQVAAVPLRSFRNAKERLRGTLDDARRELLVQRMATRVVETLLPILPTAVVSPDPEVLAFAEMLGAIPLADSAAGAPAGLRAEPVARRQAEDGQDAERDASLNEALYDAADWAAAIGAKTLVIVAADLPLITADDVLALLRGPGRPGLVLAADQYGTGTNAMAITPPYAMPFAFGVGSFLEHRMAAYRKGLRVKVVRRAGLEMDVDVPEDLDWALAADPLLVHMTEKRQVLEGELLEAGEAPPGRARFALPEAGV